MTDLKTTAINLYQEHERKEKEAAEKEKQRLKITRLCTLTGHLYRLLASSMESEVAGLAANLGELERIQTRNFHDYGKLEWVNNTVRDLHLVDDEKPILKLGGVHFGLDVALELIVYPHCEKCQALDTPERIRSLVELGAVLKHYGKKCRQCLTGKTARSNE